MKQPPLITYNLNDRARKYRGQDRNFNVKAICDAINSPACQERVKTRAMLGYFGHKPRILAGMDPVESIVVNGKYNEIEPAIVTTFLEALPDGTIKHQTEFLDSISGKKAARMYANRIGGFSSAIDQTRPEFFGFDFVLDPNYSSNRGYALDSANMTLDEVLNAAHEEEEEFWLRLVAEKDAKLADVSVTLDSLIAENEQLLSMLASKQTMVLDSVPTNTPLTVSLDSTQRFERDKKAFHSCVELPVFVQGKQEKPRDEDYDRLMSRMGV